MQSRGVNGFSESAVQAALRGENRPPQYRTRFELLDVDNALVREVTNIDLAGSEITHNYANEIKRTARFRVREATVDLDSYSGIVIADGPLFYLRLGETSGNADDSSGNGRTFTTHGGVTYSQPSLLANATDNTSVTLNGSTGYFDIADASWMDVSTAVSFECWVKTTGAVIQNLISRDDAGSNKAFQLRLQANGKVLVAFYNGGSIIAYTADGACNDGLPHHIVATFDGAYVQTYIDSVRVLKTARTLSIDNVALSIRVGADHTGSGFVNGVMDEVAMYSRALSGTEIREHYQAGSGDLAEIDFYRDRIKPYVAIKMDSNGTDGTPWAEYAQGVFLLEAPGRASDEASIFRDVDGFDQTLILKDNKTTARYTVAASTNYITAVNTALQAAGLTTTNYQLTPTASTLPGAMDWPIGTSYLRIVNDLLAAINYRSIRFDANGVGVAEPYVLPASRSSEYTYNANEDSVVREGVESVVQVADIPNVVILTRNNPDTTTLISTQTNSKIASPTSTVRRGRNIVRDIEEVTDAADQTALDNLAKRRLTEVSSLLHYVTFKTSLHPFHDDLDKITFIDTTAANALNVSGDFIETEWTLPLSETGDMVHRARLSVDVVA